MLKTRQPGPSRDRLVKFLVPLPPSIQQTQTQTQIILLASLRDEESNFWLPTRNFYNYLKFPRNYLNVNPVTCLYRVCILRVLCGADYGYAILCGLLQVTKCGKRPFVGENTRYLGSGVKGDFGGWMYTVR